jgi:hypothetical protein
VQPEEQASQEKTVRAHPTTPARSCSFQVGAHLLLLSCAEGRWTVTVDSVAFETWYTSEAEAWEAGVREADRLDHPSRP